MYTLKLCILTVTKLGSFFFVCFCFGFGGGVAEITQSISLLLANFSMPSVQFSCEEEFNMTI